MQRQLPPADRAECILAILFFVVCYRRCQCGHDKRTRSLERGTQLHGYSDGPYRLSLGFPLLALVKYRNVQDVYDALDNVTRRPVPFDVWPDRSLGVFRFGLLKYCCYCWEVFLSARFSLWSQSSLQGLCQTATHLLFRLFNHQQISFFFRCPFFSL